MSVDNLRQEALEAAAATSAAQRSLSAAISAESNAPEKEKESAKSKIEQAKSNLVAASERQTSLGQLLRAEESYEAKQKAVEEKAKEEELIKQEEKEYKKQEEQDKAKYAKLTRNDAKDAKKAAPASNLVNGEELVRSEKPLSQDEIFAKMQEMVKADQDKAATETKSEDAIELADALPVDKAALPTNPAVNQAGSTPPGAGQAVENEGIQLKGASESAGTNT